MTFDAAFNEASKDLDKQMYDIEKKLAILMKKIGSNKSQWYLYAMLDYQFFLDMISDLKSHSCGATATSTKQILKSFYDLQERLSAQ